MTGTPAWNRKVTDQQIVAAYRETGTVWKAAEQLGLAGQSVHERLRAIGYPIARRIWTKDETERLHQLIANGIPLGEVARRLGRTYAGVAARASRTEARSVPKRTKKLPRGAGFDKATTLRHLHALERSGVKPTPYARGIATDINLLVAAFQKHYPERWQAYLATHSPLPEKTCEYCSTGFIPANGKQRHCGRKCQDHARRDKSYFGGQRRNTVGLAEGICQLCGVKKTHGLSSHHVLGKENDPLNSELVALCAGCHNIVTILAGRNFVDEPAKWEALIALAWLRKHGGEIFAEPEPKTVYTEVIIELWDYNEDTLDEFETIIEALP